MIVCRLFIIPAGKLLYALNKTDPMKKAGKFIFIFFLILSGSTALQAQQNPVKWTYEVKEVSPNVYDLIFKASIDKNWHLYSQFIGTGGPVPTSFKFNDNPSYTLDGKVEEKTKGEVVHDEGFDMDLTYFSGEAVFVQRVKLTADIKEISGTLEFMACDNEKCLPPSQKNFSFKVKYKKP
jgi:thiol:disulfide interchange protein DsbD